MPSSESDDFEVIEQVEANFSPEELANVQSWLKPTDYGAQSSEFRRHLSSQAPATGLWICNTSQYQQWQTSQVHGSLWIKGVPGAGKSVIAASMIQHLRTTNDSNTPVLYFFFRQIISANRRPRSLIRDFLAQLLPYSTRLQGLLQPLTSTDMDDSSDETLWGYLLTGLSSVEKAYCVVDAMDEMELLPDDLFLGRLNKLATFQPNTVKLLMTSRPKQYLQSSLRDVSIVHISLEEDLVGKDIGLYLTHRLNQWTVLRDQKTLRDTLISTISERSRGLFLYARLLLDQIESRLGTPETETRIYLENLAKNLPIGLEEMYNSMLFQQSHRFDMNIQVFLLELATHSSRALRLNEMANAMAVTFPSEMIPEPPKVTAKSACAPLLEISEDETIQVIHHSFTEFLLNSERTKDSSRGPHFPAFNSANIHKMICLICLNYLRSGSLRLQPTVQKHRNDTTEWNYRRYLWNLDMVEDRYDYQEAKLQYPFLEYAVENWAFHASKYDVPDDGFLKTLEGFLDPKSIDFRRWLEVEWTKGRRPSESEEFIAPTPLHIAAFAGLTSYARKLLEVENLVDARDAEERTPLHWACTRGHTSMVLLLLEKGAVPDVEDCRGVRPIYEAARKNHATIVRILLEVGVDPLSPKTRENVLRRLMCGEISTKGETAVEYAYLQGHTDTIMAMVPFLTAEALEEMFCQCCRYGKFEMARSVLAATGVLPDSKSNGATALYLACRAQCVNIVELLLSQGADVHQASKWRVPNRDACGGKHLYEEPSRSPVHGVIIGWKSTNDIASRRILHLLLDSGANLEVEDENGDTPLLSLFYDNNSSANHPPDILAVKGLLQAGANVLALGRDGDSVLHRCLRGWGDIKVLKLLLEHGAHADVLGNDSNTVLHIALRNGSYFERMDDVIILLLEGGARCDVENKHKWTALEEAASSFRCSLKVFTMLLQNCSRLDAIKRCIWKLCRRDDMGETVKFIRALQKFDVLLEDRDSDGRTVLLTNTNSKELFDACIECGADVKAVDSKGRGVLYYYVSGCQDNRRVEAVQRLEDMVGMGLDPLQVDSDGNTLLHVRAKIYTGQELDDMFIQKLVQYGISTNAKNNQGMSPLHLYLENWNFHSTQRGAHRKRLDERFYERFEMPLLKILGRHEMVDIDSEDTDGVTILHLAAMRSETLLFYLLEQGGKLDNLTKKGRNALHLACRARQSNIVQYLCHIDRTMINQRDSYGRTPLHDACTSGRPESVHYLLKAGADITIVDDNKRSALHACAEYADEQKLWTLLTRHNKVSGHSLEDRFRPLPQTDPRYQPWYAMTHWSDELDIQNVCGISVIVKTLLSTGSDTMAIDTFHRTPLDLAIEYDCLEMIQALKFTVEPLKNKWNIEPEDKKLETIIARKHSSLSLMDPWEPSVRELLLNPSSYLPYLTLDDIEWLSQHNGGNNSGVHKNGSIVPSGESLLYVATSNGFAEMLNSFGPLARVNDDPKRVLARTPEYSEDAAVEHLAPMLHVACARELPNMVMVETLVGKCGVDINAHALVKSQPWTKLKDAMEGGTVLHVLAKATHWWQLEAIKFLLRNGANINSKNEKGETPLHIACTGTTYADMNCTNKVYGFWRIEAVTILLEHRADIDLLDNDGLSCLHKACSSPQIMRILLDRGAKITDGKLSPLFSAIQMQCLETLTILLDAGLSPNTICSNKNPRGHDVFSLHHIVKEETRWALFCACMANLHNQDSKDSAPMVKLLIERGADLYAPLNDSEILVHYIFKHAEYEIITAFLDCAPSNKVDFNTRDSKGCTVFLAACDWKDCLPGYNHKHWVAKETAPFIRALDFGANPLVVDNEGRNALHHLLDNPEMEDEAIIQFLSHGSAKILLHQKDANGFTPLNCALRFLRPAVVEVLLTMGADLLTPDPTNATALHQIAAQCLHTKAPLRKGWWSHKPEFYTGALDLWKKFVFLGGSINVRDNKGSPPLFYYLSSSQRDDYKAPEDSCCHLEHFATYFSDELVKDLDFHAKNKDGENSLHVIARRERNRWTKPKHDKDLFQFFVRKGLDPLEEDRRGRSSLDVAAACEQKGILELFQYRN